MMPEEKEVRELRYDYQTQLIDEMDAQRDYMRVAKKYDFRPGTEEPYGEEVRYALNWLMICRQCTWEALRRLGRLERG